MSEPIPQYTLLWWMVLTLSVAIIVYEMTKWFRSRTTSLETWVDLPRIQPPGEEVAGLTEWIRSFSKDVRGLFEFRERVLNDITETITRTLGIDRDELKELVSDDSYVERNFGAYASIVSHLSGGTGPRLSEPMMGITDPREKIRVDTFICDAVVLLDQARRWESKYESPTSHRSSQ